MYRKKEKVWPEHFRVGIIVLKGGLPMVRHIYMNVMKVLVVLQQHQNSVCEK